MVTLLPDQELGIGRTEGQETYPQTGGSEAGEQPGTQDSWMQIQSQSFMQPILTEYLLHTLGNKGVNQKDQGPASMQFHFYWGQEETNKKPVINR